MIIGTTTQTLKLHQYNKSHIDIYCLQIKHIHTKIIRIFHKEIQEYDVIKVNIKTLIMRMKIQKCLYYDTIYEYIFC